MSYYCHDCGRNHQGEPGRVPRPGRKQCPGCCAKAGEGGRKSRPRVLNSRQLRNYTNYLTRL